MIVRVHSYSVLSMIYQSSLAVASFSQRLYLITRPALANGCVQTNAARQVVLKLKTAWHDGTTHLVMSPLEFMQRLAALVPRPRLHLVRFRGVLAPNAKCRFPFTLSLLLFHLAQLSLSP